MPDATAHRGRIDHEGVAYGIQIVGRQQVSRFRRFLQIALRDAGGRDALGLLPAPPVRTKEPARQDIAAGPLDGGFQPGGQRLAGDRLGQKGGHAGIARPRHKLLVAVAGQHDHRHQRVGTVRVVADQPGQRDS
jgi:hypothetical protein